MEVREAIARAKQYVQEVFADEKIANLGLEEVEFDESTASWSVTLGFSRPWDFHTQNMALTMPGSRLPRAYKIVQISEKTGQVLSVKNHETGHAA